MDILYKFSEDDYEELYYRIRHKLNNLYLLLETKIDVQKMGRKMVWEKQRAKEKIKILEDLLIDMKVPKSNK